MEKIQDLSSGDARKEILVDARKTDDLMGKDRADNDDLVVVEDQPVDLHRHIQGEQAAGEVGNLLGSYRADLNQRLRLVPSVIEEANAAKAALALGSRDFQPPANRFLAHRLMRAQRNQHIKRFCDFREL